MEKTKENKKTGLGVQRQEGETVGSLSRRFTQKVKQSSRLIDARSKQFHKKEPNKTAKRKSALVRAQDREKYKKLRKWGKVQ